MGPKTLYGFTKLASEMLIEEFSFLFNIKFIINRCGVLSGPLQFGKQDQGFVSLWIWKHLNRKNLNKANRCFKPCNKCDVVGDLVGKKHVAAWSKIQ